MNKRDAYRRFYLSTACECDPSAPAADRCNLSGWIRCNVRLMAWRAHPDNPERKVKP